MLDRPLILAVDKYRRFLASKLLLENLMTSGIGLGNPRYPAELRNMGLRMHEGLQGLLTGPYGLRLNADGTRWIPKTVDELNKDYR